MARAQKTCEIAPWIVASRWMVSRALLRDRLHGYESIVDLLLEWAFSDQAPGVWCVQRSWLLEEAELGPMAHPFGLFGGGHYGRNRGATNAYGISSGPYAVHIQKSLLMATTPREVTAYAWVACVEYGSERVMREKALEVESRVPGFDILLHSSARGGRVDLLRWQRRERIKRIGRHPGVGSVSRSEAGAWFASTERTWHRICDADHGFLVYDTYTTPSGELGYREPSDPQLSGWTVIEESDLQLEHFPGPRSCGNDRSCRDN